MRSTLAENLLARIMGWSPEEIDVERPLLQAMANLKWNEYQQFSPGTRFIESLVKWLQQFETIDERKIAYKLIKEHLIFISNEQMAHLVDILFTEKVNPIILNKTAIEKCISPYLVTRIRQDTLYENNLRMSLFIGLSDGCRIDQFRRGAQLNNEQVVAMYSISEDKARDMHTKLQESIPGSKFKTVFLLDDFTASGKSYYRSDEGGKLNKILCLLFKKGGIYYDIVDHESLDIHILFYIATIDALNNIEEGINNWKSINKIEFKSSVQCLLSIDENVKLKITSDVELMTFMAKYFDDDIVDEHYKKGKHDLPYLGFNECSLPIVLNHNTPNNSVAILWMPPDKKYKGLFQRVSRHKES